MTEPSKEVIIKIRLAEFEKFFYLLMKNAPEGYAPWFFSCKKNGKDPCPEAILKIDPASKGSWHHPFARLSKEQCIEHIKNGYNIGISARKDDPLIIGDIDNPEYINQLPKDTLTVTSRKRIGAHFFGWNKDGSAKINLPTNDGEIRSDNQYVLAPGSYVPFDLTKTKDAEVYTLLPKEAKDDEFFGYYTIRNNMPPKAISFFDFPEFFQKKQKQNIEIEMKIKQAEERKKYIGIGSGKYTDLFNLKVSDIIGLIPSTKRRGHPLHESDTDANFSISADGCLAHCWRHLVSLNAVQYLCVKAGYAPCEDAGTPHKERGLSKIKGDKKAIESAYQEAVKLGLIKKYEEEKPKNDLEIFTRRGQIEAFWKLHPFFFDKSKMFWAWDDEDKKWILSDEVDFCNLINQKLGIDTIKRNDKGELVEGFKQVGRKHKPKDAEKNWIQFKDKIYDAKTGKELFDASPDYFMTNPVPYKVGDSEDTPTIDKYFSEWVDKKWIKTLYQIIAYNIGSNKFMQRIIALCGGGSNGKGTYIKLNYKFLGEDNCVSSEIKNLSEDKFEPAVLYKKLLCVMGEVSYDDLKNTNQLKKLGGEDKISFQFKGKTPFTKDNTATCVCLTNSMPITPDKSIGFYRKWLLIDFPNQFKKINEDLIEKIPEIEFENLAKKSLRILKEMYDTPEFENEGSFEERAERYEQRSNPVMHFVEECCEEISDKTISLRDFTNACNDYLKEKHLRICTAHQIGKMLREEGFQIGPRKTDDGGSCYVIINLSLKTSKKRITSIISTRFLYRETNRKDASNRRSTSSLEDENEELNELLDEKEELNELLDEKEEISVEKLENAAKQA